MHFTNRSKFKKQEEDTSVFKEDFRPKIVGNWRGRGSGLEGSWERFPMVALWLPNWP